MRHGTVRSVRPGIPDVGAPVVLSWPVSRPRWVALLEPGLLAAAMAGAAYCLASPYVLTMGLSLWWVRERSRRIRAEASSGVLSLGADDRWQWAPSDGARMAHLCPVRVWLGPFWISLRFVDQDRLVSKDAMLQVTLWKSRVPPQAWRRLQVCLASRIARPAIVAAQGGQ
ncbi:MAG TPA: protein YgfX [Burkholderiaceae bacterium]|nr:protein YgfX [Burkholderiaceae bacterium]